MGHLRARRNSSSLKVDVTKKEKEKFKGRAMSSSPQAATTTTNATNTTATNKTTSKQSLSGHGNQKQRRGQQEIDIEALSSIVVVEESERRTKPKVGRDKSSSSGGSSRGSSTRRSTGEAASISSAEQVITSLQVNSKKATAAEIDGPISPQVAPEGGGPSLAAAATTATAAGRQQQQQLVVVPATKATSRRATSSQRVLDPAGTLYYHWSMVVSFAFLYNFWSLSYRFAFREIDTATMAVWFALDYSADLIYVLDIVVNCHTGYLEDGVLQRNVDKIRQHYGESTIFYLDCLCLLPLDVLYLSFGFNSVLRFTRLVKIYKFWSYVDRTERHTNYPNVFRTFALVHYILVIFHWNACLFHMISKNSEYFSFSPFPSSGQLLPPSHFIDRSALIDNIDTSGAHFKKFHTHTK